MSLDTDHTIFCIKMGTLAASGLALVESFDFSICAGSLLAQAEYYRESPHFLTLTDVNYHCFSLMVQLKLICGKEWFSYHLSIISFHFPGGIVKISSMKDCKFNVEAVHTIFLIKMGILAASGFRSVKSVCVK